jgi:hypothetical protein
MMSSVPGQKKQGHEGALSFRKSPAHGSELGS